MNVLLVSQDFSAADICMRLQKEGHNVRVYVGNKSDRQAGAAGMVTFVKRWQSELDWVGKEGLILFDTTGFGKIQDDLRKKGYAVIGGSEGGDRCEDDRIYGQKVLAKAGVKTVASQDFRTSEAAIRFIKSHPDEWVIKQNGHSSKIFNYVGELADGSDCIDMLRTYQDHKTCGPSDTITLQQRVRGIEIGVGRYFNGSDWVGPVEMNIEHKDLCNGNLGPKTWEMGTLMWFDSNEENKLFKEVLANLNGYLKKINFRGDVEINCIVNENGAYPLEFTARFGFPALQLQCVLADSPIGEFLKAVADGRQYDFRYKKGYGVVVLVATPPFPYGVNLGKDSLRGTAVTFKKPLSDEERNRTHFEEVSQKKTGEYYNSGENGFIVHVSGTGKTVEEARKQAYALADNVVVPKKFYRTDIGLKFIEEDQAQLKKWGWI